MSKPSVQKSSLESRQMDASQSTINQNEPVADGNASQVSGGMVPTVALAPAVSLEKTHDQ
jgi:hypothetical protein